MTIDHEATTKDDASFLLSIATSYALAVVCALGWLAG
jgi:hypothetical protein